MFVRSRSFYGWVLISILSITPLIIVLTQNASLIDTSNIIQFTNLLGRAAALTGLVTFSITIFMSGRHRQMESFFGGMNRVYIAHHLLGLVTVILLLTHPFLLLLSNALISWDFAVSFLLDTSIGLMIGKSALFLLVTLIAITLWGKLPYQIWRATHKYMGVAFLLGGIHALMMESDLESIPLLKVYVYAVFTIASASYLYRTVFGRFLVQRYKYVVVRVESVTDSMFEIFLKPIKNKMAYKAGQFIFVGFNNITLGSEVHPFSITSKEINGDLSIAVKKSGDFTNSINQLQPGDTAYIEGPFGSFSYYNYPAQKQIWIAGGVGITPFISMLRSMKDRVEKRDVHMYISERQRTDQAFVAEIQKLSRDLPNLTVSRIVTSEQGRISAEQIAKENQLDEETMIFICGPLPMILSLKKEFKKLGIKGYNIITEEFSLN